MWEWDGEERRARTRMIIVGTIPAMIGKAASAMTDALCCEGKFSLAAQTDGW